MGLPAAIRVEQIDQGTEFVSRDLDLWAYQRGVSPGQESQPTMIHRSVQRSLQSRVSERALVLEPRRWPAAIQR